MLGITADDARNIIKEQPLRYLTSIEAYINNAAYDGKTEIRVDQHMICAKNRALLEENGFVVGTIEEKVIGQKDTWRYIRVSWPIPETPKAL